MSKRQRTVDAGRRVYRITDEDDTIKPDTIEVEAKDGDNDFSKNFAFDANNEAVVFDGVVLESDEKILITYEVEQSYEETV